MAGQRWGRKRTKDGQVYQPLEFGYVWCLFWYVVGVSEVFVALRTHMLQVIYALGFVGNRVNTCQRSLQICTLRCPTDKQLFFLHILLWETTNIDFRWMILIWSLQPFHSVLPSVALGAASLKFVVEAVYLEHIISSNLKDDSDVYKQERVAALLDGVFDEVNWEGGVGDHVRSDALRDTLLTVVMNCLLKELAISFCH